MFYQKFSITRKQIIDKYSKWRASMDMPVSYLFLLLLLIIWSRPVLLPHFLPSFFFSSFFRDGHLSLCGVFLLLNHFLPTILTTCSYTFSLCPGFYFFNLFSPPSFPTVCAWESLHCCLPMTVTKATCESVMGSERIYSNLL